MRLPCSSAGDPTRRWTTWAKNGREIVLGGGAEPSSPPGGQRLTLLPDGTLNIAEATPADEGSYLCNSTLQDNSTAWAQVQLRVTSKLPVSSIKVSSKHDCQFWKTQLLKL